MLDIDLLAIVDQLDDLSLDELTELYAYVSDFEETPVDIKTFIEDPEYLGNYFNGKFNPYWMGVMQEIYPSPIYSPYWLISLRGSIGRGKSTAACTGICYDLYKLMCMGSPQDRLGLIRSTKIVFAIFNVTLGLATDVIWDQLSQMFVASPFFHRLMNHGRRAEGDTLFPKRVDFFTGSRLGHTLGKAVHSAILSEANFEVLNDQVEKNFKSILRRMQSRFLERGKGIPGKIWIDSSEGDKLAAMNRLVDSYKSHSGVYIDKGPIWQVWPLRYGEDMFRVFKGNELKAPKIIDMTLAEDKAIIVDDPTGILYVPEEHRSDFEADIINALRDLGGIPTVGSIKFIRQHVKIREAGAVALLFPEVFQVDFYDEMDDIMSRTLNRLYFEHLANPATPRCIHIDVAISGDRLGFASSYISGFSNMVTRDLTTFETIYEEVPNVITEFAFAIECKSEQEIPLHKITNFIRHLTKIGYPVLMVTTDGFQSTEMRQKLTLCGYKAELVSVDRTIVPYVQWRSMVYRGTTKYPKHNLLMREMMDLEMSADGKKVDHPDKSDFYSGNGSKDVADAVCGSVYDCITHIEDYKRMAFYSIPPPHTKAGSDLLYGLMQQMKKSPKTNAIDFP
jgi:hypothetical protein